MQNNASQHHASPRQISICRGEIKTNWNMSRVDGQIWETPLPFNGIAAIWFHDTQLLKILFSTVCIWLICDWLLSSHCHAMLWSLVNIKSYILYYGKVFVVNGLACFTLTTRTSNCCFVCSICLVSFEVLSLQNSSMYKNKIFSGWISQKSSSLKFWLKSDS